MSTLLLTLALLTQAPTGALSDDEAQRDFAAANERALKGDHQAAVGLYQTLVDRGVHHEDLFYNLGNAQAAAQKPVEAIISYERALLLSPSDQDARANLEAVRASLRPKRKSQPNLQEAPVVLADVVRPLIAPLPKGPALWTLLICNALFFGILIALGRRSIRALKFGAAAALLGASISGLIVLGHAVLASDQRAVVRTRTVLKEGPHPRFKDKQAAERGAGVRILKRDNSWLEVQQADGTAGWLKSNQVTLVKLP